MIDWLIKNMEWVFSGIGVIVLLAIWALITRHVGKRNQHSAALVVEQPGSSPDPVEGLASITPSEVQTSIESAPPLQRDAVAQRYIGQRIVWDTELANARKENNIVRLQLQAKKERTSRYPFPYYAWCTVKLGDYRELAILPAKARIRVRGTIKKVDSSSAELEDVQLTFLPSK